MWGPPTKECLRRCLTNIDGKGPCGHVHSNAYGLEWKSSYQRRRGEGCDKKNKTRKMMKTMKEMKKTTMKEFGVDFWGSEDIENQTYTRKLGLSRYPRPHADDTQERVDFTPTITTPNYTRPAQHYSPSSVDVALLYYTCHY